MKYYRGNDGDIIKHGMLAEFVEWWLEVNKGKTFRMADPFSGHPYREICSDYRERLDELNDFSMYKVWDEYEKTYCNSSHLVMKIAKERGEQAEILASDKYSESYECLKTSGIKPIESEFQDYDNKRGYSILSPDEYADKFDLIFIDPYGKFLPKEIYKEIPPMIDKNPELFIMVFVIDRFPKNYISENERRIHNCWEKFKGNYQDSIFSIQCDGHKECDGYKQGTYSIVLFSDCLMYKPDVSKLEERLERFSEAAQKIIPSCEMF